MASTRDVLLLTAIAVCLPVCVLRPVFGIVLWYVLGFLNPQAFTWGIAREAPLALAVAAATLTGSLLALRLKRLVCLEMGLLFLFWVWMTVTTLNSADAPMFAHKSADAWFRWRFVSKILLTTALTVAVIDTSKHFRWLLIAIGGSFGLLSLRALPHILLSGGRFRVYGPEFSMIADNNAFGLAVNMALPFLLYLASTETRRWRRWFFGVAFAAAIPTILFTYSRGALVGLVAMSFWMILRSNKRLFLLPVAALVVLFAMFLTPQAWRDRMGATASGSIDASAQARLNSWRLCWNLASAFPVMGGGFEAFTPELYAQFAPDPTLVHGPHSIYFGVLAEHGFTGFLLYLALAFYCFVSLYRLGKAAARYGDEETISYTNMLRFSLIGFLTSGAFLGHAYFDFYFANVACVALLNRIVRQEWRAWEYAAELDEPEGALSPPHTSRPAAGPFGHGWQIAQER